MPAQQVVVQPVHADVDGQAQQADGDHAGDDLVGPEVLARFQDAETEAVVHGDHLGDDHHDEGGADADPHARQDVGHGGRQDHAQEHGAAAGAQVARGAQVDAVDLAHAGDGVHQHREKGAQRDQEHGRRIAQPEPQDRQRDVGDRRNRAQQLHQRIEPARRRAGWRPSPGPSGSARPAPIREADHHPVQAAERIDDQLARNGPGQPAAAPVVAAAAAAGIRSTCAPPPAATAAPAD